MLEKISISAIYNKVNLTIWSMWIEKVLNTYILFVGLWLPYTSHYLEK